MDLRLHHIITNARETLADARSGLEFAKANTNYDQKRAGIKMAISNGRSVTFALQHMKGKAEGFDQWWEAQQALMRANPLFVALNEARTNVVHEGRDPAHMGTHFHNLDGRAMMALIAKHPAPAPNAEFFFGDMQGRSGWVIREKGKPLRRYYVDIPDNEPGLSISTTLHLHGMPDDIKYEEADTLLTRYLDEVERIIYEAERLFVPD